ncbi:uncharacterized protein LOC125234977 isoform X2 [Leguminivora glycinivorella]|uniref:uncharacterized protein LOC125234977 isoform X2 n=1 Tax=Leguminivora glycinivorella TaxID=1035111 RepID=UPI00200C9A2D|nr:uncharacterized protein LOC125234977 isoform X2 [Leguminivora glycinivorella]
MSAVTTEYYEFIKKLEENDDKLIPNPLEQPVDFEFNNSTCHVCNGYYGPSFGEPVCVTCHAFLYPNFPSFCPNSYYYSEKTDDGDSGNDEPSDLNYSSDRRVNRVCMVPASWWYINSLDSESPEDEASNSAGGNAASASGSGSGNNSNTNGNGLGHGSDHPGVPDNEEEVSQPLALRPEPLALRPPPCLAHSLQALSTPRPPDNVAPELIAQLPTEVLLGIFSYLDDLSLSACGAVCARWRGLVRARVRAPRWAAFAARRWPLYRPLTNNRDWYKVYQSLVESCFCRNCLVQMCVQAQPPGEESAWRHNRLRIELKVPNESTGGPLPDSHPAPERVPARRRRHRLRAPQLVAGAHHQQSAHLHTEPAHGPLYCCVHGTGARRDVRARPRALREPGAPLDMALRHARHLALLSS